MIEAARPQSVRIPALDGMRGCAVWLVIAYHTLRIPFGSVAPGTRMVAFDEAWLTLFSAGWVGVDLFFVLSGFLITGILLESKASVEHALRNFYARRFLRIVPAYFAFLLFLFYGLPFFLPAEAEGIGALRSDQAWFWTYLLNLRSLFDTTPLGSTPFLYGHLWSLMIEEQFYLFWPWIVLLCSRRGLVWFTVSLALGAVLARFVLLDFGVPVLDVYTLTVGRLDELTLGALVAIGVRDESVRERLRRFAGPAGFLAAVGLLGLAGVRGAFQSTDPAVLRFGLPLVGLLCASWLAHVILTPGSRSTRALEGRALRSAGRYSYALYIWHLPVLTLLLRHTGLAASIPEVAGSFVPRVLAIAAIAVGISWLLAALSWRLIEQPALRLRSWFPQAPAIWDDGAGTFNRSGANREPPE